MARAVSSALGVVLLTALTLVLAAVTGVAVLATVPADSVSSADVPERVVLSASVDASTGNVVLVHEAGPELDVREIEVRISVSDSRLRHQPPVPFSGATGFRWPPTGPFNERTDPHWEVGERAGLWIAGTNDPDVTEGDAVRVELYRGDVPIAAVETTAR